MSLLFGYIGIIGIIFLLFMINRQIIGAGLYGTINPLLFVLLIQSNFLSLFEISLIIVMTFIAWKFTNIIMRKIYGSQILKMILYHWFTLILFVLSYDIITKYFPGFTDLSFGEIRDGSTILILIGYILLSSSILIKIYNYLQGKKFFSQFSYMGWFLSLIIIISYILGSEKILYQFMESPIYIIFITILILIVGIYNGLQLKELIRFRQLIRLQLKREKRNIKQ